MLPGWEVASAHPLGQLARTRVSVPNDTAEAQAVELCAPAAEGNGVCAATDGDGEALLVAVVDAGGADAARVGVTESVGVDTVGVGVTDTVGVGVTDTVGVGVTDTVGVGVTGDGACGDDGGNDRVGDTVRVADGLADAVGAAEA
jgi:hypothetical protein